MSMNFFKKLFGSKEESNSNNEKPQPTKPVTDALKLKQLEELVAPLIRDCTRLVIAEASRPIEDSNLQSHFGGQPYFEEGEHWPKSKAGQHLSFVFQAFNTGEMHLPENIKLIQFYYDFQECPWSSEDDGWLVKVYEELHSEKVILIEKPKDLETTKFCQITFEKAKSLPDWEGLDSYSQEISDLVCEINDDEPWEEYSKLVQKLTGQEDYRSQFGGYPQWVQGESTPEDKEGKPFDLLFQIDSEDNAGLMWGDVGLVYAFYDGRKKKIEFELQCH